MFTCHIGYLVGFGLLLNVSTLSAQLPRPPKVDYSWVQESWVPNDAAFRTIRFRIAREIKVGDHPKAIAARYAQYFTKALRSPSSALHQFAWGYAAYRQVQVLNLMTDGGMAPARDGMAAVKSPRSYEFARLRFLLEAATRSDKALYPMVPRLMRRDPSDTAVMYQATYVANYKVPAQRNSALAFARRVIQRSPNHPSGYSALASAYHSSWYATGRKDYAQKAIATYQKLKAMPGVDALGKRQIQFSIDRIRSGKRS